MPEKWPTYPLWAHIVAFPVGDGTDRVSLIVTRARSQLEAHDYMRRCYGDWVAAMTYENMPVNAAEVYSETHADGWLERPPIWLVREGKA